MTKKRTERILEDFRLLAGELQPEELPTWLLERGRAMQFYARARSADTPEQRLLSLYNGYVALPGEEGAAALAGQDLGEDGDRLGQALERCRQEGDAQTGASGCGLTQPELERLQAGLRRRILER